MAGAPARMCTDNFVKRDDYSQLALRIYTRLYDLFQRVCAAF
jgi:hypothetical protein